MQIVKGLIFKLFVLLVVVVGLFFGVDNSQEVPITFLEFTSPAFPISGWVLLSFVLGVLFASVVNTWTNTRLRLANRKAKGEIQKTHKHLDQANAAAEVEAS